MKKIIISLVIAYIFCPGIFFVANAVFASQNEDKALDELAQKMLSKPDKLKGKRICMFKFTSIEGKETQEGAKISRLLMERLIDNDFLKFVDRSELAKIVGEQELEQSGLVDRALTDEGSKLLPIDLMITGTFARINNKAHISAKVLNANTGEVYIAKSAEYDETGQIMAESTKAKSGDAALSGTETGGSPEAVALFKNSPEKLERINQTFFNLERMSEKRPLLFLMAVLDKPEMDKIEKDKPRLATAIKERRTQLEKKEPVVLRKIGKLKKGIQIMKESYPSRYELIMKKKTEVLNRRPQR